MDIKELLGDLIQEKDKDKYFGCYLWHYFLSNHLNLKKIGEIGVRFGYALKAFILGSLSTNHKEHLYIYGWDNACNEEGSVDLVNNYFKDKYPNIYINVNLLDTQTVSDLEIKDLDLFHVDGDHTEAGSYHDLNLAWKAIHENGHILVDDMAIPETARGVHRFIWENNLQGTLIPMHTVALLIPKNQKSSMIFPVADYVGKAWSC